MNPDYDSSRDGEGFRRVSSEDAIIVPKPTRTLVLILQATLVFLGVGISLIPIFVPIWLYSAIAIGYKDHEQNELRDVRLSLIDEVMNGLVTKEIVDSNEVEVVANDGEDRRNNLKKTANIQGQHSYDLLRSNFIVEADGASNCDIKAEGQMSCVNPYGYTMKLERIAGDLVVTVLDR